MQSAPDREADEQSRLPHRPKLCRFLTTITDGSAWFHSTDVSEEVEQCRSQSLWTKGLLRT